MKTKKHFFTHPLAREAFTIFLGEGVALRSWAPATRRCYEGVLQMMDRFDPALRLDRIGCRTLERMFLHLSERHLANRSIGWYLTVMKSFLSWASKRGYAVDDTFRDFNPRIKTVPKTVVFLTWDELMVLYGCDRTSWSARRQIVADWFLLSCFTGLRVSDIASLRWSDIQDGCLVVVTQKTAVPIRIEINRFSNEILSRCRERSDGSGSIMPALDLRNMNKTLKELCRALGFDDLVTSYSYREGGTRVERVRPKWQELSMHCGRRTFICNALALGISPTVVMQWTGHRNYSSLKPYIAVSDGEKARQMAKFDAVRVSPATK